MREFGIGPVLLVVVPGIAPFIVAKFLVLKQELLI